jgi:hypothetical protein
MTRVALSIGAFFAEYAASIATRSFDPMRHQQQNFVLPPPRREGHAGMGQREGRN